MRVTGPGPGVLSAWWPLALSWLLMGLEMPLIAAVVGRLPDDELMLAAFGGVVFPLALLIESPIIMMLAASTALARDARAWHRLNRSMHVTSALLTAILALLILTPLFELVVVDLLDVPQSVQGPVRTGLIWMLPWTWAIADRRTRQGLLIRFGRKIAVAQGTGIRLVGTTCAIAAFALSGSPGVVVAAGSLSVGVLIEAAWARWAARDLIVGDLASASADDVPSDLGALLRFYTPLALTPMLILAAQPLGTAGMTRMNEAVMSMAVWAPLNGLVFLLRSAGLAYNEVVIAHIDDPGWACALRRFAHKAGLIASALLACISLPWLAGIWFEDVQGLDADLSALGATALWLAIPIPWLTFMQSWCQGRLVAAHRTRAVTISVVCFLVVTGATLAGGVWIGAWSGLVVAVAASTLGNGAQLLWLALAASILPSNEGNPISTSSITGNRTGKTIEAP
ncbi:MAG: hypothetical protein MK101_10840 [Phycisphaerales bacterium]|nr:hypothetical protein [Phycisphaerales bacterium]